MSAGSDWQPIGSKGFGFTSDSGTPHGVRKATLKSGASGKAMAIVKAKGLNVPDDLVPDLPLPVTALIFNDANGTCFEATFDSGDVITNDGTRFKAKSQ
jgi:hypothetical protein